MKHACVNIVNQDKKCFLWSILASLYAQESNPHRVSKYKQYENELNMKGIDYPVKIKDISYFEKLNNISVSVYALNYKNNVIPIRISKLNGEKHVDLLVLNRGNDNHYVLINNLSRSVGGQLNKRENKRFICPYCLHGCHTEQLLKNHIEKCSNHEAQRTTLPKPRENILTFRNTEAQLPLPFVIYFDFESILEKVQHCEPEGTHSWTQDSERHVPCSFCIYTVSSDKRFYSPPICYFGEDAGEVFLDTILGEVMKIRKFLNNKIKIEMTYEDNLEFAQANECHICQNPFRSSDVKVRDHDHLTGIILYIFYLT